MINSFQNKKLSQSFLEQKLFDSFYCISSKRSALKDFEQYIKQIAVKLYRNTKEFQDFNWENLHIRLSDNSLENACFISAKDFHLSDCSENSSNDLLWRRFKTFI